MYFGRMDKQEKLEFYFNATSPWKSGIHRLRQLIRTTALIEDWKWNFPTYTYKGKNVVGLASHKTHFALWFFQGVFLKDKKKLLRNAQEGKTKAMRSLNYTSLDKLDDEIALEYILEAINNCKDGKEVKPSPNKTAIVIPAELKKALDENKGLADSFKKLSPSKQREYTEHISCAKHEHTRLRRLKKCIPLIISGAGLNDKYKKI